MSIIELQERRTSAADRLDGLRRERGSAVLSNGAFDKLNGAIAATEAELEALSEAEAEATRVAREAAAVAEAVRKAEALRRLAQTRDEYLADIAKVTEALDVVVASMRGAIAKNSAMCRDMEELGGTITLGGPEFEKRASYWLSAELQKITGHPGHFGSMKIHLGPRTVAPNWHAAEQLDIDRALAPFLNPERTSNES